MDWRLALVSIAFVPISLLASGLFYGKISARFLVADEAEGELTTCAQENLTGVRVVRAFGRERYEIDRFAQKNNRFSALWVELGKVLSVYWASGVFLVCLQIMAVIVAGTVAAVNGSITQTLWARPPCRSARPGWPWIGWAISSKPPRRATAPPPKS